MKPTKSLTVVLLLLLFIKVSIAAPLTSTEANIINNVTITNNNALKFLEKVVNINSGTMNFEGVKQVGLLFADEFKKIGFSSTWVDLSKKTNRAGYLIAQKQGKNKQQILLIGHVDTVFTKDSPFQKYQNRGELAVGPGVIDAKGGAVTTLYALKALHATGVLNDATITVILFGDEEDTGPSADISRKILFAMAGQTKVALGFEWSLDLNSATVARRGIDTWILITEGKRGHSSKIFNKNTSRGAIFELVRIIHTFFEEMQKHQFLSLNTGIILGGSAVSYNEDESKGTAFGKKNTIPMIARAVGDLRFISKEQRQKAHKKMQSIANNHLFGTTANLHFIEGKPAMSPSKQNYNLLKKLSNISEKLELGTVTAVDPMHRGAADISYIAALGVPSLAGLGPVGHGAHSTNETIVLESLPIATKRVALLVYALLS